jgi:hypothetical protein
MEQYFIDKINRIVIKFYLILILDNFLFSQIKLKICKENLKTFNKKIYHLVSNQISKP